jgi:outer membrane protein assembly factor BamB
MKMKNKIKTWLPCMIMVVMFTITDLELKAQDWPQWRGQNRDGVSKETGLNLDWSSSKPALRWVYRKSGFGYSAPVIVGTTLYCQGGSNGTDFAFAIDVDTAKLIWKQELGAEFEQDRGNGPRGSVTVDGDKLYLIRGGGQIHCLSAADGKMLWQQDFTTDLGGKIMSGWGFSESPLVDGNLVICTPGGDAGTMVALDKNTGAVVWRTKEWTDPCGYSSAIVAEVGGIRQYIQQASKGVAGISAKDGKLLWRIDNAAYRTAVIPTPVFNDNIVYVTNGYTGACIGIGLTKEGESIKADTIYTNKVISNKQGGVVLINGYIYGNSETSGGSWVCQNFETGEMVWSKRNQEIGTIGNGSIIGSGDQVL